MIYDNFKTLNKRIKSKDYNKKDKLYFRYLKNIEKKKLPSTEIIFQFPIYVGIKSLSRYLMFYELYKSTKNLSGHIADIGSWKGSSIIFLAKLVYIFENHSNTKLFGFDWFKGQKIGKNDNKKNTGKYSSSYNELKNNIKMQDINKIEIVKIDLSKNLNVFFKRNPWIRFKYVFIDCGLQNVLEKSVPLFWQRLVKGGIMVLDHYNSSISPTESTIVDKTIGNNKVLNFDFSGHPTGYVVKK